jgi:hypothetical protein
MTKIVFQDLFLAFDHGQAKSSTSSEYQVATAEAHRRHLAALFFHGLSNKSHCELKKNVHNNALMDLDTVPSTYNKVLQLADLYESSYQPLPAGGRGGGVTFAQKGKTGGSTPASTPLDASAKKSLERKPHPVPGKKHTNIKMIANVLGKKTVSTAELQTTGLSTALISPPLNTKNSPGWPTSPSVKTSLMALDSYKMSPPMPPSLPPAKH